MTFHIISKKILLVPGIGFISYSRTLESVIFQPCCRSRLGRLFSFIWPSDFCFSVSLAGDRKPIQPDVFRHLREQPRGTARGDIWTEESHRSDSLAELFGEVTGRHRWGAHPRFFFSSTFLNNFNSDPCKHNQEIILKAPSHWWVGLCRVRVRVGFAFNLDGQLCNVDRSMFEERGSWKI